MRVAVDAMGGDFAPGEVVHGALLAARADETLEVVLVGQQGAIENELAQLTSVPSTISIRDAADVIGMDEHPAAAVRRKRQSSLVICGQMVKRGEADATMSMGNTGAAMAIATLDIGRIPGIERPAIATALPTLRGRTLLTDAGANVDCSPTNLIQFALLGSVYAERVLGVDRPRIGLLNIGSEEGKGNELVRATYDLLKNQPLNFIGNIEGKDVFEGAADVVVCDGFAGNVLLKSGEGVAELIVAMLQAEMSASPEIAASMDVFKPILHRLLKRIDYSETGGAPLLGVNGVSFIGHGRSKAKAIASAIAAAAKAAGTGYVQAIKDALPALHEAAK